MKARFLIDFISQNFLTNDIDRNLLNNFAWDSHLVTAFFSKLNISGLREILCTIPVDISQIDTTYKAYRAQGISVHSVYMQKDEASRPLRLDFPIKTDDQTSAYEHALRTIRVSFAWSYPGLDVPLPVFLAHTKCEVRKGCADVLYREIITRSTSTDPFENIINEKLKR